MGFRRQDPAAGVTGRGHQDRIEREHHHQLEDRVAGPGGCLGRRALAWPVVEQGDGLQATGPCCWRHRPMLKIFANKDMSAVLTRSLLLGRL
jgi:hypothetical protein